MIASVSTRRFVPCPREGCDGEFSVEHMLSDESWSGRRFGPWYCDARHCDVVMDGVVTSDGLDVTFSKREHKRGLALLKFGDALLVYEEHRLHDPKDIETYDYFFHSHQCPINLIRGSVDVFIGGDRDVHAQIRYVSSVEDTPEVRKQLDAVNGLGDLFVLFGTDGSLPPTRWPARDEGLIPWLAELRRMKQKED